MMQLMIFATERDCARALTHVRSAHKASVDLRRQESIACRRDSPLTVPAYRDHHRMQRFIASCSRAFRQQLVE